MAALSENTKKKIANLLIEDIGAKEVLDGITYVLLTANDKAKINEIEQLRADIQADGVQADQVIRTWKVSNGVIFDLNIAVAKQTAEFLVASSDQMGLTNTGSMNKDLVGNKPEKRRQEDIEKLAAFLKTCWKEGKHAVELCLYSRNKVGVTTFNARRGGQDVRVKYNAFAIRHWDISVINDNLLAREEFKVVKVEAGEIVPSKNGVRFKLYLGK